MSETCPSLESRFLEPQGWQWGSFERNGHTIRFGCVFPENPPDAIIACLPGLSEFCEKYFETARDMLAHNYAFYVLDWAGQGKSSRYLPNPHKRHSEGFQNDIDDLHELITAHIQLANKTGAPLIMLAHSMGGNIGLHYLAQHHKIFACAGLSAPMLGMAEFEKTPKLIQKLLPLAKTLMGTAYVAGGGNWSEDIRTALGDNLFSSDPLRNAVHNQWSLADKDLQVGNITYGWLYHAVKACANLPLKTIQTHCLIASAEKEAIVDNNAINTAVKLLPNAKHIVLPDSKHEILMENDEIRGEFLNVFNQLIKETIDDY